MKRFHGLARALAPAALCAVLAGAAVAARAARAPAGAVTEGATAVVARVGDRVLTEADLAALVHAPGGDAARAARLRPAAIRGWMAEELLAQEALRRGLERSDPVVRRRLAAVVYEQDVMAPACAGEADADALRAFYREHADRFREPARTLGYHVVLRPGPGSGAEDARAWAARVGAAMAAGPEDLDRTLGECARAGLAVEVISALEAPWRASEIERRFGAEVARSVAAPDAAERPVIVAAGAAVHVAWAVARTPAFVPPFEKVANRVADEARRDDCRGRYQALMAELTRRYGAQGWTDAAEGEDEP